MAAFDTTRPFAASGRATSIFATVFALFADWNDARQTRKALSVLTDRELDDIGLSRADIESVTAR